MPVLAVDVVVCLAVEEVYLPQPRWLLSPERGQIPTATKFLCYMGGFRELEES